MTVHFGGVSCDMQAILAIAQRHGLAVIEDVSHAHGGTWNDRGLGSIGDVGCFSCGSGKNLSAGGGGVLITSDPRHLRTRQRLRRTQPSAPPASTRAHRAWARHDPPPRSSSPTPPATAACIPSTPCSVCRNSQRLDEQTARRDANGRYLAGLLDDLEGVTPRRQDAFATRAANHLFVLRYNAQAFGGPSRELFVKALNAEGIPCQTEYLRPMHRADLFADS